MRFVTFCIAVVAGLVCIASCHKSPPTAPSETVSLSVGTTTTDTGGITLSAVSLSFGALTIGQTSSVQTLTVTNGGTTSISVSAITVSGDFSVAHGCGPTIEPSGSCSVAVTFAPQALGTRAGGLTIDDNSATGPHIVPLDGTGRFAQSLSAVPTYLSLPSVLVGSSATGTITLTNAGAGTVTVSGVSLASSGDFSQSNTCSGLSGGGSCTITVSFLPTSPGNRAAAITISDDAPGSPHVVPVVGFAYANEPTLSLVQPSLVFPTTAPGSTSAPGTAQFMNIGPAALNVQSITTTGDFAQTNSCPSALAQGAICAMNVTFTPTAPGTRTGAITIIDNAAGSPHTITLNGTGGGGSAAGPLVALSTTALTFPSTGLGARSEVKTVGVSNNGSAVLALDGISASGDFSETSTCGTALAPGATCTIAVTFTPTAPGTRGGTITITDSAPGSPHSVVLAGTGTGFVGPHLVTSPAAVMFGARTVGVPGGTLDVTVMNPGNEPLILRSVSVDGDFAASGCQAMVVAPRGSCVLTIAFTPTALGSRAGTLTIADDAQDSPHQVVLTGEGTYVQLTFSPTSLTFSSVSVGSTSETQSVTLANAGTVAIGVASVTVSGDFAVTNDCGGLIGANSTCTVSITFTPSVPGIRTGVLTIVDAAPGSPHEMTLKGTGTQTIVFLP